MNKKGSTFIKLIKHQRFKEAFTIYILINLGVLLSIYGFILYYPALIPDAEDLNPENARAELMNNTKGAFIAQNFDMPRYNLGFDMLNFGSLFLLIGMLFYNYIETFPRSKKLLKRKLSTYSLHKKGWLKGNIFEWLCMIVFCFAFFTFFNNIFFYIIITSFILGVIGFTIRKIPKIKQWPNQLHA